MPRLDIVLLRDDTQFQLESFSIKQIDLFQSFKWERFLFLKIRVAFQVFFPSTFLAFWQIIYEYY